MGSLKFITADGSPENLPIARDTQVVFYPRDEFGGDDNPAVTVLEFQNKAYEIPLHYLLVKMELGPHYANSSRMSTTLSPDMNYDLVSAIIDRGFMPKAAAKPAPVTPPESLPLRPSATPERPLERLVAAA